MSGFSALKKLRKLLQGWTSLPGAVLHFPGQEEAGWALGHMAAWQVFVFPTTWTQNTAGS